MMEDAMTDEEIRRVILFVADETWEIASTGNAPPEVCLAIEALSDDPERCEKLVAAIKADFAIDGQPPLPPSPPIR